MSTTPISSMSPPKQQEPLQQQNETRREHSSFHIAILHKNFEEVRALLAQASKKRELLHVFDENGYSPLERALQTGNLSLIQLLIDQGADINLADPNGMTAVHFAARIENLDVLKFIIEQGGDIHMKANINHREPLYHALKYASLEAATYLLNAGSNINAKAQDGEGYMSVAFSAATVKQESLIQLLLDHQIETSQVEWGYQTAIARGLPRIEQLLSGYLLAKKEKAVLEALCPSKNIEQLQRKTQGNIKTELEQLEEPFDREIFRAGQRPMQMCGSAIFST